MPMNSSKLKLQVVTAIFTGSYMHV